MLAFACASCRKELSVADDLAGKSVRCPACGQVVAVPPPAATPASPTGPRAAGPKGTQALPPRNQGQGGQQSLSDAEGPTAAGAGGKGEETRALPAAVPDPELTAFLAPPQASDELGRLGGYRVLKVLGHGGMGVVFQGEDPKLGRKVAIKAMLPHLAGSRASQERFLREARTAATLEHDHVVPIYHVGEERGASFIVMPFLKGEALDARLRREKVLPIPEILRIGREAAEGLAAAHALDLIHRDIKPANLWLEGDKGRVKILDFGLARAAGDVALTQSGAVVGTLQYMAPEQAAGQKDLDHRCDLFSLGCVLYRMATGRLPFRGEDTLEIFSALARDTPEPPSALRPEVPGPLSELVMQLLAKKPEERPPSAQAVVAALAALAAETGMAAALNGSKTRKEKSAGTTTIEAARSGPVPPAGKRRPWLWLGIGGAACVLALAAVVLFWQTPQGTVRIETDDPDVEVVFDKTGPTIKGADKEPITLRAGEHGVLVRRGDFSFETDKLLIQKGQTITLKVELLNGQMRLVQDGRVIAARDMPLPRTFTNCLGMEFVLVPKGKSWLGGGDGKVGSKEVEIPSDFYLGKYEVTQGEWRLVMGSNPSHFQNVPGVAKGEQERFPVETVSWEDAQLFLKKLNALGRRPGWEYRLPTEAEWEYACRGGPLDDKADSAYDFYFADPLTRLLPGQANFDKTGLKRTCKVGSYQPNRLGLYDMHGNVEEWCADEAKDDKGASLRVHRGGHWFYAARYCGAAHRYPHAASYRYFNLGLRLARVPVGKEIVKFIATEEKKPAQALPSPLDKLDPKNIPAAERFPWQPKELVAVLGEHHRRHVSTAVAQVAYSGDGRWIASIAEDGLRLLDAKTLHEVLTPPALQPDRGFSVAFSGDGKHLAAGMRQNIVVWDVSGPEPRQRFTIPLPMAWSLDFSADGRTLAVVVQAGGWTLSLWDVNGPEPKERSKRAVIGFNCGRVAFSPDAKTLAAGCAPDDTPILWDLTQDPPVRKEGPAKAEASGHATPLVFSPDGKALVTVSKTKDKLYIWDVTQSPPVKKASQPYQAWKSGGGIALSQDGKTLAAGADGVAIYQFDSSAWKAEHRFDLSVGRNVWQLALSPDGRVLVTGTLTYSADVRVWDLAAKSGQERQPLGPLHCYFPAFSADGTRLAVGNVWAGGAILWDLTGPRPVRLPVPPDGVGAVDCAFTPDGNSLVAWGLYGTGLLRLQNGVVNHWTSLGKDGFFPARALAADGKRLATGGAKDLVRFWDLSSGDPRMETEVKLIPAPRFDIDRDAGIPLAVSPALRWAANGWDDGTVHVWDLAAGKESGTLKTSGLWPLVAFARDGQMLAFSDGRVVRLCDLAGMVLRERAMSLKAGLTPLSALDFAPDGHRLAGTDDAGNLYVWDVATGERTYHCRLKPRAPFRHPTTRWAEDGRHLATVNSDGTIYILRLAPPR
jgi:formylglycine-generating enzyme required for sulfatase activity/WD40 repeat protein